VSKSSSALTNPPLICVVAKVKIKSLTSKEIKDYIPSIQKELRLARYPESGKSIQGRLDINPQTKQMVSTEIPQWLFYNLEKTVCLLLDEEGFSIAFSSYKNFTTELSHYETLLGILQKEIPKITVESYSLRYVDHIPMQEGQDYTQWVIQTLLGVPNLGGSVREGSVSETVLKVESGGKIFFRCTTFPNGNAIPPNLLHLQMQWDAQKTETAFITLDSVHTTPVKNHDFNAETTIAELKTLKDPLNDVFFLTTTQEAQKTWL